MKGKCFTDRIRRISIAKNEPIRIALRLIRCDKEMPVRARMLAQKELAELPRSSSMSRLNRRCTENYRGIAVIPEYGIGRHAFRSEALAGRLLGVTKSCW